MKKCIIFCIFVLLSCKPVAYTSLPKLLNKCKGFAIVVDKAHNFENYRKSEHYTLILKDSTNKTYQFKGGEYTCKVGDTLIVK